MTVKGTPQNRKRKLSDTAVEPTSAKKATLTPVQGKKTPPGSAQKGQTPQQQKLTPKALNKSPQSATTPKLSTPKAKTPTPKTKTPTPKAKTPQKIKNNTKVEDDDEDLEEEDEDEEAIQPAKKKSKQETVIKGKQNQKAQNKSPEKTVSGTQSDDVDVARKTDRDAKTLFLKNLPGNCTHKEIRALSSDIKQVRMRINTRVYAKNSRLGYAYVEFASEELAEKNFAILGAASIRGNQLTVDYVGAKSLNVKKQKPLADEEKDPLKLYLAGLPLDVTEADVRKLFPKAKEIVLPIRKKDKKSFGYGFVTFTSPELAKQAHDKTQDVSIKGVTLVVLYAKLRKVKPEAPEKKIKPKKENKKKNPAEKNAKVESKQDDDDEEEDDDEEDDDEEEGMDEEDGDEDGDDDDDDDDEDDDDDDEEDDDEEDDDDEDDDDEDEDDQE